MPRSKKPEEEHCLKVSISFQPDDYDRMMKYCQREERTFSWVIRKALNEWLDKHDK